MNWYDASADAKAANEKAAAEGKPLITVPPEGLCFRPDDGTPFGKYRVVAEGLSKKTWAVWDMRRFDETRQQPVKVRGGMVDRTAALVYAELYAQSRALRLAYVVARSLAQTVQAAAKTARETSIAVKVVRGLRAIPAAWRDEDSLEP